jgi:hypothetical protein
MYKEWFDKLSELRDKLNDMEDEFKFLGHELKCPDVHKQVNRTVGLFIALRDGFHAVDKALEIEMENEREGKRNR